MRASGVSAPTRPGPRRRPTPPPSAERRSARACLGDAAGCFFSADLVGEAAPFFSAGEAATGFFSGDALRAGEPPSLAGDSARSLAAAAGEAAAFFFSALALGAMVGAAGSGWEGAWRR